MKYLLDTCVLSEMTRARPAESVVAVTRNVADMAGMGVSLFNPFK